MSPLAAAAEDARTAWSKLPSNAPTWLRNELRAAFLDAEERRYAHWSPSTVIGDLEAGIFAHSEQLPGYVAPSIPYGDGELTAAREAAIVARDAADRAARAESSRLYAARRDLEAAIVAYTAAYVAERAAAVAYSHAADTSCNLATEAQRRIGVAEERIAGLRVAA